MPGPGRAVYSAMKAFVLSFSEALHRELEPHGVRVTVLCPGPVPTALQARAGMTGVLPRSAEKVAREAYRGLSEGRRMVVPGPRQSRGGDGDSPLSAQPLARADRAAATARR